MNSMYQQLMQLPLFQGVTTEKITELVEKLPFHFLKFRNGEQIFAAGDACTHVRFIVSGKVRLETAFTSLRVTLCQTLETPHVLAAEYLFGRETTYPYTATAEGPCGILQLRKSDYIKMVSSDKVFLFNILNYLSSGSQRSVASLLMTRDGSVAERLAMIVDSLLVNGARDVQLRYKQKDLCTLLGTQRTTLISTLDKLQDQDIIEYDSNELTIVDVCRLLDMLIA
ncbi:MAG: Crp/Fnr family transcriptional regulator [Muribaculaceae bacterium]|nr:Crp/Fnr family transcriptional regulator [Muribaculaceae bacterium]